MSFDETNGRRTCRLRNVRTRDGYAPGKKLASGTEPGRASSRPLSAVCQKSDEPAARTSRQYTGGRVRRAALYLPAGMLGARRVATRDRSREGTWGLASSVRTGGGSEAGERRWEADGGMLPHTRFSQPMYPETGSVRGRACR